MIAGTKLYLAVEVANNGRNLQLTLDDKAGGWNVTIGWA